MTIENGSTLHAELFVRDDEIYVLTLKNASHQAIDDTLQFIDSIWLEHQENQLPIYVLIEALVDTSIPMGYALSQSIKQMSRYKNIPKRRIAFVISQTAMLNFLDTFFQIMHFGIKHRYFSPENRQSAIEWLKEPA